MLDSLKGFNYFEDSQHDVIIFYFPWSQTVSDIVFPNKERGFSFLDLLELSNGNKNKEVVQDRIVSNLNLSHYVGDLDFLTLLKNENESYFSMSTPECNCGLFPIFSILPQNNIFDTERGGSLVTLRMEGALFALLLTLILLLYLFLANLLCLGERIFSLLLTNLLL
jgi:hypothetical protein